MACSRWLHYPLIGLVWAIVGLPNLGGPSLWDIDEGNNAEAAREMLLADNWVVPNFNYRLREDKPALLYWCQIAAYQTFGVNEFAARFPSAVATLLTALTLYELARAMFAPLVGLLAGIALPSSLLFCGAGHFANPDALLTLTLTLAFAFFWAWYRGHHWAALPTGISIGLGVLAKGPVAVVMPLAVWTLFMLWQRRFWRLFQPSWLLGLSAWVVVALPWYAWVTVETRGAWLSGFWFRHNQGRFLNAMETHGGPIVYYLPVVLLGLAPWSLYLIHSIADAIRRARQPVEGEDALRQRDATRYLLVWAGFYFAFFSLAATKLPNYVLPIYPALIVLVAHRLERWRQGEALARWVVPAATIALLITATVLLLVPPILGGTLFPDLLQGKHLPGIEQLAALAVLPLLSAGIGLWYYRRRDVVGYLTSLAVLSTVTTALFVGWAPGVLEPHKAIKELAKALPADHLDRDVRVVAHDYFQPSVVFYTQRLVEFLPGTEATVTALRGPQPTYALMTVRNWKVIRDASPGIGREVARRHDLYRRLDVVLVTNEPPTDLARR